VADIVRLGPHPAVATRSGRGVLSSVTVMELLVGARDRAAEGQVLELLGRLPVVALDRELAGLAGRMGRAARAEGMTLPLPDLAIAASGRWLGVPSLPPTRTSPGGPRWQPRPQRGSRGTDSSWTPDRWCLELRVSLSPPLTRPPRPETAPGVGFVWFLPNSGKGPG